MYSGYSTTAVPLPVPVPAPVRQGPSVTPSSVFAAPRITPSPVPLPVPIASPPHIAALASPASPSVFTVPRPVAAAPTPDSSPAAPPAPIGSGFTGSFPPSSGLSIPVPAPFASSPSNVSASPPLPPPVPLLTPSALSSTATPAVPQPVTAPQRMQPSVPVQIPSPVRPTVASPWLQPSSSSPPPLASVLAASPSVTAARPSTAKTVTFSLPGERVEAPAAPTPIPTSTAASMLPAPSPPVATPLSISLRVPTLVTAAPSAPLLAGPGNSIMMPAVRLPASAASPSPLVTLPSVAAPPAPSTSTSSSATGRLITSSSTPLVPALPMPARTSNTPSLPPTNAHETRPFASETATPVVPALPTAGTPLSRLPQPSPHVPTLPRTASLTIPSLPTPLPPPMPPAASLSTLHLLPLAVPTFPTPVASPYASAAAFPTLHATEEEAATEPLPIEWVAEVQLVIPDYSKWLYPVCLSYAAAAPQAMKFPLTEAKAPATLPHSALLQWCDADVLASLPATLPPEYVIFGGARYSGAPLDLLRPPPPHPKAQEKRSSAYYESVEAQRLQFLQDQLAVAKNYLRIETRRMTEVRNAVATAVPNANSSLPKANGVEGVLVKPGEEEDLSKATIWTTAYFGSPQQLHRVLATKKFDGMLSCAGQVQYRHRQWGLKRAGETFVLGLGMKATALQFAAAAGKLDCVVLLLINGAKDDAAPRLKDILSKEAMEMIASICAPRPRPTRAARASPVVDPVVPDAHSGTASTFLSEQVMGIEDSAYSQMGSTPYYSTTPS